jgi:hypothetical protein
LGLDHVPVMQSKTEMMLLCATRSFVKKSMKQGKRRAVADTRDFRTRPQTCRVAFEMSSLLSRTMISL